MAAAHGSGASPDTRPAEPARPGPPMVGERDRVTGLPTRLAFAAWLAAAVKAGSPGCAVLIDLDGFARVNDAHGRAAGDRLLAQAAARLAEGLPAGAGLAHRGADEFLVLLPQADAAAARAWVEPARVRLQGAFDLPRGDAVRLTASAGIVALDGSPADDLLRACDVAMYAAKARGRDRCVVYDQDTRRFLARRREVTADLQELQARRPALQGQAHTDAATGLGDARGLEELLATSLDETGPVGAEAAVACLAIDRAPSVAPQADEALHSVAVTLRRRARDGDRLFRCGASSFAIVYPGLAGEAAFVAAERLRESVESLALAADGAGAGIVTVSVGVASGSGPRRLAELHAAAQAQLGAARDGGRGNRVQAVVLGG